MTVDFYNKNVPEAQFKICWGNEHCTPVFCLYPGGMGSYDLSFSHNIQWGTQCHVYAWCANTNSFNCAITFIYEETEKGHAIFNYFINKMTNKADFKKSERY